MTEILFQWEGFDEAIAAFENFVPALERDLQKGAREAGKYIVSRAQERTRAKGAVGASKGFYQGWKYQPDSGPLAVQGSVVNTAAYARPVEFGRGAGKPMPPHNDAFAAWLAFRGIDPKLSFVIRRSIGRDGIPGLNILDAIVEQDAPAVYALLEKYLGQAIDRVWRTS